MAEGLTENVGMYKIWKNPSDSVQPVAYQGEFRPPDGQFSSRPGTSKPLDSARGLYRSRAGGREPP